MYWMRENGRERRDDDRRGTARHGAARHGGQGKHDGARNVRGQHNRGQGRAADAKIRRSKQFSPRAALLPDGWSPASITHSDDRAIVAYARAVTGHDILSTDAALTAINAHGNLMTLATIRYRATTWWRDYGRHVHAGSTTRC